MSAHDLHIWEATNDPGEPTCINGNANRSDGFSLSLYRDDEGVIIGGVISTEGGIVDAFGYIHAGEYLAEVQSR